MIRLYTAETIDQMIWPETKEGQFAKRYLLPLFKHDPTTFIANAKTKLYVVRIGDKIIPLTQNEKEYENSYLLSSFFVIAHLKEKNKAWLAPFIGLLGGFLKWAKINQVIIINNWLLSTNPYPELSEKELSLLTLFLQKHFPRHYFMFRSITTYKNESMYQACKRAQFRMLFSRSVFLYDPEATSQLTQSMIRKQKKDFNKIARQNYTIEELQQPTEEETSHLLDLYEQVYMGKYTKYSPQYTPQFLKQLIENKTMQLKVLKKEGRIYGAAGFLEKEGYLLTNFFGYDTRVPQEEGLYRMLSGVIMQEIHKTKLLAHQGSGAADFKLWRGFTRESEYVAIFDRHLPFYRRLFWMMAHLAKKHPPKHPLSVSESSEEG